MSAAYHGELIEKTSKITICVSLKDIVSIKRRAKNDYWGKKQDKLQEANELNAKDRAINLVTCSLQKQEVFFWLVIGSA